MIDGRTNRWGTIAVEDVRTLVETALHERRRGQPCPPQAVAADLFAFCRFCGLADALNLVTASIARPAGRGGRRSRVLTAVEDEI